MGKIYSRKTYYKSITQLNPDDSPSTGSLVCYDGDIEYSDDGEQSCIFVEIADCHQKVRLHQTHTDTIKEFLIKLDFLIIQLTKFRNFLEFKSPHKPSKQSNTKSDAPSSAPKFKVGYIIKLSNSSLKNGLKEEWLTIDEVDSSDNTYLVHSKIMRGGVWIQENEIGFYAEPKMQTI